MPETSQPTAKPAALITGASRGIGAAIAIRLARDGFPVAGCSATPGPAADKVRAEVSAAGVPAYFATCDVRDADAVEAFVSDSERALGPLGVLVNNAGITRDKPMVVMSPDDWGVVIDTNLTGTWNFCRIVGFRLAKRQGGAVINISSVAGLTGNAGQTNYAATKAGIIGMSKSMARELARFGVRVNVVAPGFIATDMTDALPEATRAKALGKIPLGRFGDPGDVAALVAFLASGQADYITGQVLQVDGGIVL